MYIVSSTYWKEKETHILLFGTVFIWRCELNIIFNCFIEYWQEVHGWKNHSTMKRERFNKAWNLATILSRRYMCDNLKFLLIIFQYSISMCKSFALYLCWHWFATMPRLNERQRGEAIRFLLRGEHQISVPERFHVSQSTLSRLRRRMLTTGSLLNDHFRSGCPRVATQRQYQDNPLLHLSMSKI
jgi:hypothetical protein